MATLEVAHQLGFVWVARLYNGEITTLDPPDAPKYTKRTPRSAVEQHRRSAPFQDIFPAFDSPDLADHHRDQGITNQGFVDTPTETLVSSDTSGPFDIYVSAPTSVTTHQSRTDDILIYFAHSPPNQTSGGVTPTLTPFTFFDIPQDGHINFDDNEPEDPEYHLSPLIPSGPLNITHFNQQKRNRSVVRDNALLATQVCINLGLSESSSILLDQAVQDALFDLVQRTRPGLRGTASLTPIPLWNLDVASPLVLSILLESPILIRQTLDHLHSLSVPAWKASLAISHSAQRDFLCEAMLQPRGLETGFTDPVFKYYQAWETDIQPHLDRLDRILVDIYGESSVQPIILRLREEQASKVYDGRKGSVGGRGPLLIRLVDVCRMWNDTIASYKVQKMLFSEGLESCE